MMEGRSRFTPEEAAEIRDLLGRVRRAERADQKRLRAGLRRIGFRISDWGVGGDGGFTTSDFDELIERGRISIDGSEAATSKYELAHEMDTSTLKWSTVVENAAQSLTAPRYSLQDAPSHVEDVLGLYAVYGEIGVWHALGLGDPPDDRPLYVGKAEASLISRDLRTHFADGRTGSSTVRRSVAALLHDQLQLRGVPRNLRKPAYFHNYGLAPADDAKLTAWMNQYLELCVWAQGGDVELIEVERELLKKWRPPLNLQDVETPWKAMLSAKRKLMADEAREVAAGR